MAGNMNITMVFERKLLPNAVGRIPVSPKRTGHCCIENLEPKPFFMSHYNLYQCTNS